MKENTLSEVAEIIREIVPIALGTLLSAVVVHIFDSAQRGEVSVGFNGVHMEFEKSTKYLKGAETNE